jgi:hypothetical protein
VTNSVRDRGLKHYTFGLSILWLILVTLSGENWTDHDVFWGPALVSARFQLSLYGRGNPPPVVFPHLI